MISSLEALNFRCIRYTKTQLHKFNVLVGPNASGKTTFLEAISFIKTTVAQGPEFAIKDRADSIYDLLWNRRGTAFELAVEALIPRNVRERLPDPNDYDTVRYELKIGLSSETHEAGILGERVVLKMADQPEPTERLLFPGAIEAPERIYDEAKRPAGRNVIHKVPGKNDNFYTEINPLKGKGWIPSFKFGSQKSALGNLPDDGTRFPVATWLRQFLTDGVQSLVLNSQLIRKPSPPGQPLHFKPDGSNIPWVLMRLESESPARFSQWIEHVRTALPDIVTISTVEREEDKHRYLLVKYKNGIEVPSWMVSDGTLRFLALTLIAYLKDFDGLYLIEEPENGIHPRAVEPLFQSLSSVYDAQVLIATHSPVILGLVDVGDVLCFACDGGATDIARGSEHPALRDWRGEASLGMLFASGILG